MNNEIYLLREALTEALVTLQNVYTYAVMDSAIKRRKEMEKEFYGILAKNN